MKILTETTKINILQQEKRRFSIAFNMLKKVLPSFVASMISFYGSLEASPRRSRGDDDGGGGNDNPHPPHYVYKDLLPL